MYKYFSEKNTTNWVKPLSKFLNAINNSVTRATGVKPSSINTKNWPLIWKKLYGDTLKFKYTKTKLNKGDAVRISEPKTVFSKGYFPSRSDHIYTIEEVHRMDPEFYILKNDSGEIVKGRFYRPELVKTIKDDQTTYRIEKIIRMRKKNREKEYLVKFIGYPKTYWLNESDIVK